jgi:UDP-glucose 4-epimerase
LNAINFGLLERGYQVVRLKTEARQFFQGKSILLTGGTGYLASGIMAILKDIDCRIIRLIRQEPACEPDGGASKIDDLIGDVRDPEIWERCLDGVDIVYHLAAQTSTYIANADPLVDQAVNVQPMLRLLETCRRRGMQPTVCFASTVTVAGIPKRLPVDEAHPDHPLTVYDLHKQMAEQYLHWYGEQGFVRGVTLRLANVYGPGPRSGSMDRGILNQMIYRALAGEPLTVFGAGEQIRDYVFIEDVAMAFIAAALNSEKLNAGHFIIGSAEGHSIAEAMRMIAKYAEVRTGNAVQVLHVSPPATQSPIEGRNFIADIKLFQEITGWRPQYSLAEGVTRTMEKNP